MVFLLNIILLVSLLSMSYAQINHNEESNGVKYFRHNQNIGFYSFEPRKILFPITGLPKFRKIIYSSAHLRLGNYANEYATNSNDGYRSNSFMESNFGTPRSEDTSSTKNINKDSVTPASHAKTTVDAVQDNQTSVSSQDNSEGAKITEEVTEISEDFTTPTVETTTVEDYDELQRMAVPPQVVASLLG
ncbi:unnamed protein product, partial [Brenthis ino]